MNIKELINKSLKGEELSDDEKTFLANYEESEPVDVDKIVQTRLAREKRKHDKEKDSLQERLEELEASINDNNPDEAKSELDKAQGKLERMQAKLEKQAQTLSERESNLTLAQKEAVIKDIKSSLKLVGHADQEFVDFTLNKLTADMDVEEIRESSSMISDQFTESHPTLIRAEGSGTGIPAENSGGATGKTSFSMEEIQNMSAEEFLANESAITDAVFNDRVE